MIRTAAILAAGALALAACAVGSPQQRSDGASAPDGAVLTWPYGDRDPAYTTGDDVYPWPLGQDKLDP